MKARPNPFITNNKMLRPSQICDKILICVKLIRMIENDNLRSRNEKQKH